MTILGVTSNQFYSLSIKLGEIFTVYYIAMPTLRPRKVTPENVTPLKKTQPPKPKITSDSYKTPPLQDVRGFKGPDPEPTLQDPPKTIEIANLMLMMLFIET